MRLKTAITKKDIIVVLVCLVFLIINLGAMSYRGRRRAKRVLCLTNLKQLTLAWTDYAVDNDGKLVNGDTGENPYSHINETPWVQKDWEPGITLVQKEQAIRDGALWPYCMDLKLYKCATGLWGTARMYCAVDAMNCRGWDTHRVMLKTITAIPNPNERAVFLDDGGTAGATFGGWTQYSIYSTNRWIWWDPPPIRHDKGTTFSFADSHSEYWKWKDRRTIEWYSTTPQYNNPDLIRSQIASWGD